MTTTYRPTTERKRSVGGIQLNIDVALLVAIFFLLLIGLVMVFSASWDISYKTYGSNTTMFFRQVAWMAIGVVLAVIVSHIDYHQYRRFATIGIIVTFILLIAVLFINEQRFGASRTLSKGSIMPSEAAKLAVIVYLCVWLYAKRHVIHMISFGLFPLGVILGVFGGMILLQPDVSAVITIIMLGGILFFVAGGDLKQIFILVMVAVLFGLLVVTLQPTAKVRMEDYANGLRDFTEASFHVRRSIESFVRGGLFGVGIGNSETKLISLPVPPTDSIFAVVAEETGLVGTSIIVFLYIVLAWRGMRIAQKAPDMLGSLLAAGLTFWIVIEAFINMGMMVGLMPFAGNALPFISLGGSNLVVSLVAIGVIMNVARSINRADHQDERKEHAFDGVRRGNRRRDISRTRRSAGIRR